jgi:hypothetical protein
VAIVVAFPVINTPLSLKRIHIILNLTAISGSAVLDNVDGTELCIFTERCGITDKLKHVRGMLTYPRKAVRASPCHPGGRRLIIVPFLPDIV